MGRIHDVADARDLIWTATQDELVTQSSVAHTVTHPLDVHAMFRSICDHGMKLQWRESDSNVVKFTIVDQTRTVVSAMENVMSCLEIENEGGNFSSDMLETYLLTSNINKPQLRLSLLDVFGEIKTLKTASVAVVRGIKRQSTVTQESPGSELTINVSDSIKCTVRYASKWMESGKHVSEWGIESRSTNLGARKKKNKQALQSITTGILSARVKELQKCNNVRMTCEIATKMITKQEHDVTIVCFLDNTSSA